MKSTEDKLTLNALYEAFGNMTYSMISYNNDESPCLILKFDDLCECQDAQLTLHTFLKTYE